MDAIKGNRIVWVDALRGGLIMLVVLGHSLQYGDFFNRHSFNIIYSFHMAAFFAISGYVTSMDKGIVETMKKRGKQLMIPYFTWSMLTLLLFGSLTKEGFLGIITTPDSNYTYWFIYVLFLISIIAAALCSIVGKSGFDKMIALIVGGGILIVLQVITYSKIFGFNLIAFYFVFYMMGMMAKSYNFKIGTIPLIIVTMLWAVGAWFWKMNEVALPLKSLPLPDSILIFAYRFVVATLGCIMCLGVAMKFLNKKSAGFIHVLSYLGQISLGIYIVHLFLRALFGQAYLQLYPSTTSVFFVVADFCLKIALSVIIVSIIRKITIVSLFLLGKGN